MEKNYFNTFLIKKYFYKNILHHITICGKKKRLSLDHK